MIERVVYKNIAKIGDPTLRSLVESAARLLLENWFFALVLLLLWRFPYIIADISNSEVTPTRFVGAGESATWQSNMAKALVIACLTMSYNLLFGFSGIVSFGHALFFGAGAYLTFIMMFEYDSAFQFKALVIVLFVMLCLALFTDIPVRNLFVLLITALLAVFLLLPDEGGLKFYQAVGIAILGSIFLSLFSGVVTLRLRGVYFAMFTLALAEVFVVLARSSTWIDITGGGDGLPLRDLFQDNRIPTDLVSLPRPQDGLPLTNRLHMYQLTVAYFVFVFLAIRRYLNSPTGRVMQAIRENEQRARTIGYNAFYYKLITMMFAGIIASLSGILYILWGVDKQVTPDYMSLSYTVTPLLYSLIGGAGTLTGPVLASLGLELGEDYFFNDTIRLGQNIRLPLQTELGIGTVWQWLWVVLILVVLWLFWSRMRAWITRTATGRTAQLSLAALVIVGPAALFGLLAGVLYPFSTEPAIGTIWQWLFLLLLSGVLWFIRKQIARSANRIFKIAHTRPSLDALTRSASRFKRWYIAAVIALSLILGFLIAGELGTAWDMNSKSYLVSDIWQLFLGTVFVIVVMVLPNGVVGTWNRWRIRRRIREMERELAQRKALG